MTSRPRWRLPDERIVLPLLALDFDGERVSSRSLRKQVSRSGVSKRRRDDIAAGQFRGCVELRGPLSPEKACTQPGGGSGDAGISAQPPRPSSASTSRTTRMRLYQRQPPATAFPRVWLAGARRRRCLSIQRLPIVDAPPEKLWPRWHRGNRVSRLRQQPPQGGVVPAQLVAGGIPMPTNPVPQPLRLGHEL